MRVGLVERAMRGDQEAFASLAASIVNGCYQLAFQILRDPHRAEDATQQALLGAWRDLPTLRDPERFDAWLHRLVVNACYQEARLPPSVPLNARRGASSPTCVPGRT